MADWKSEIKALKTRPRHVLFLCVANSSRSQMAEGIASSVAGKDIQISSAGSEPRSVNPLAIEVLKEIGIDITNHRSKSVADIDATTVDLVITLCAEEVCPVFSGKVTRFHWAMPDPAAIGSPKASQLAFRKVRDELKQRIEFLFGK